VFQVKTETRNIWYNYSTTAKEAEMVWKFQ